VSYAQGALLESLSVVLHALSRVRLSIGNLAVICGDGPIGLIALAAARASGAHPLVITDVELKRLKFTKEFAPTCSDVTKGSLKIQVIDERDIEI